MSQNGYGFAEIAGDYGDNGDNNAVMLMVTTTIMKIAMLMLKAIAMMIYCYSAYGDGEEYAVMLAKR